MVPDEFSRLLPVTIRGWFWQEAARLGIDTDQVKLFTEPMQGKIGTVPSLDSALEKCTRSGTRELALDGSIRAIIEKGYRVVAPIKPLLIKLVYEINRRFALPLPPVPATVRDRLPASEMVVAKLNAMVRFGALNVSSFSDTAPYHQLTRIKNTAWAILQDETRSSAVAKASAPVQFKCSSGQLDEMRNGVMAAEGGVCTTFAAAAVSLLLEDETLRASSPRIEFVSGPKHCLCLVNRTPHENDRIGGRSDSIVSYPLWNDEVVIIDPWAGSMGYHVLSTKESYPPKLKAMIGLKVDRYYVSG